MVPTKASKSFIEAFLLAVLLTDATTMADTDIKRLIQSRHRFRAHLKHLFTSITELLDCCSTADPEKEDIDTLAELLSQLERKKTILTDLDTRIMSIINENELEAELLESEGLQLEILKAIFAKGKRLQKCLQVLELPPLVVPQAKDKEAQPPPKDTSEPPTTLETNPAETVPPPVDSKIQTDETRQQPVVPLLLLHYMQHMHPTQLCIYPGLTNRLSMVMHWTGSHFGMASMLQLTLIGVQKLNYLRSQLRGEACDVIAGLSVTNPNYDNSVALPKDQYGQPHKLVSAHMQALIDLPKPLNT